MKIIKNEQNGLVNMVMLLVLPNYIKNILDIDMIKLEEMVLL